MNASARLEHGLRGILGRDRLVLTLGLPLVAGLTQRELAGVIAHEFGHFRQRFGMRVNFLIRTVDGWFARVVYGRDGWDAALGDLMSGLRRQHYTVIILAVCTRAGIQATRGVLWVLMMLGHVVSAASMREMEHDADRAATSVVGSTAFVSAMTRLRLLGAVYDESLQTMGEFWQRHFQLLNNLPLFIEHRLASVSPETFAAGASVGRVRRVWLSTHPGMAERVRRAQQRGEAGEEISDAPARELFADFDGLSRRVTLAYYADDLHLPTQPKFLLTLEQFLSAAARLSVPPAANRQIR